MWDEAISACVKSLAFDPTRVGVYSNLGLIYDKKGNVDEAISQYKKASALDPYLSEVHYNLGLAYAKKGEIDEAIAAFIKALAIKPHSAGTHYNLANAYYKKGNNFENVKTLAFALFYSQSGEKILILPPSNFISTGVVYPVNDRRKFLSPYLKNAVNLSYQHIFPFSHDTGILLIPPFQTKKRIDHAV